MDHTIDASVQQHLNVSNFEGKFDVKDFVASISEKLISQSKASTGPFNPTPFIRSFEVAVDQLIQIRNDVQAKTEKMEKNVRVTERDYSKKMQELNRGFESVGQSFSTMETKMNEVGRTAVRIGEQLESVHQHRERAKAAYDLIDYYNQFSRDEISRLDTLKKEGKEGRRQVAVILRRLVIVAREVDLPHAEQTREAIDKYCETFEKEILNLFDRAYRKGDPKMMHHCAQTLQDFNGGASCVQVYVNQHDFFISRVQHRAFDNDDPIWTALPDADAPAPKSESGLSDLFAEIRTTVGQEAQIVQAVFPNPALVMQVFLQRVFAQSIQQHLEQLLNRILSSSELAFLRILQLVHHQTSVLVEDLKVYELPTFAPRSPTDSDINKTFNLPHPAVGHSSVISASITTLLETALEELFVPYTEGQRYIEKESKSLSDLYAGHLAAFTRYHERSQKAKSSMLSGVVNRLGAAATQTSSSGSLTTSAQAAAAFMRLGGITAEKKQENPNEEPVREEDGQLTLDMAEKMLKWHAEAIGRCVELTAPQEVPKHTFTLLKVLAEVIGTSYLEVALETSTTALANADQKTQPSLQPLQVLHSVDLICHLWQQYVTDAIFPLASTSVTVRRDMVVFNNQTVSRIEGAANGFLQRMIDSIVAWLSAQLSKQKKNDFAPRNDDLSFARVNTEPCVACCELLEKVGDGARECSSGKNLEVLLTEVGVAFHSLLLDHLRKFPVNATGGLMLAKDLKSYQDTVATFRIPSLSERFEFIRQLGNVFLIQPEILKSYITEGYLGRIDASLLRPYLCQRTDWAQFGNRFYEEDDTLGELGPPDSNSAVGGKGSTVESLKDRLGMGRLSMMVRDLESLRLSGEGSGMSVMMANFPVGFSPNFNLSTRRNSRNSDS
ncbi:exocyst complex component Sec10 [Thelephora terrestris]|uniref:Exocyst complex component Sec10 n=1 Tax=Thelephora terrestris TaxID=56493 RepID=A0A9P6L2J8_9AGAM|nr:exocyst complex component Sec10 [Thelephora terrestris]